MTEALVSTSWLQDHLDDADLKVLEIASNPDAAVFRKGHIPGARRVFWKDLCWHQSDRQFVTPEELAGRLSKLGIGSDDTLVLYGNPVQYGCYAFWALTMAGHKKLRLLDGTNSKWMAEGRPLTQDVVRPATAEYKPGEPDASMRMGRDAVLAGLGKPGRLLLDVRSPEEYSGERVMEYPKFDHGAERAGRIPGAVHLFFKNLLNSDDTFKTADELRAVFRRAGATPEQTGEVVIYCRLSHRASLAWVAMKFVLGYGHARIYDGSWTEWGSIVGFPVEIGT